MIVKNGMVAFPGEKDFLIRDLKIENGKIAEVGRGLSGSDDEVDASGRWVLPGGIDPHVHFYDPGYTEKEDFSHGTRAAAAGGITTIIDMPCTSVPVVTDAKNLRKKLESVASKAVVDYGFFGGVSRQLFDSGYEEAMGSLATEVLGYKCYAVSGMEEVWGALDHWRFRKVLETAHELGVTVLLHAEDAEYVNNATAHYRREGKGPRQWYDCRPEPAEVLAVRSALHLAQETGTDLHIVHVGTAEAAELLKGSDSTGETCPQYLAFALEDFLQQGAVLKIAPSIKSAGNQARLWELLADGTLSFAASDHAPGTPGEKAGDDIWANSAGIAGTETILPYLFSEGFLRRRLTLSRYLEIMSENAARRYRLFDKKGSLEVGKDADLVLVDSGATWTVCGAEFFSKGKLTPFEGMTFRGRVERTIVRGRTVYDRRTAVTTEGGWGRFQRPAR